MIRVRDRGLLQGPARDRAPEGPGRERRRSSPDGDPQSQPMLRLPPAYRPATRRVFASAGSATPDWAVGPGRVDVTPQGQVSLVSDCAPAADDCSATGASSRWTGSRSGPTSSAGCLRA